MMKRNWPFNLFLIFKLFLMNCIVQPEKKEKMQRQGRNGLGMKGWLWGVVDGGPRVYLHAICAGHRGHISQ